MIDYNIVVNGFNTLWRIPLIPRRDTALLWVEGHPDIDALTLELIPEMPRGHALLPRRNRIRRVTVAFVDKFSDDFLELLDVDCIAERDERSGINLALSQASPRTEYSDLHQTFYPVVVRVNDGDFTFFAHDQDMWNWRCNLNDLGFRRVRVGRFDELQQPRCDQPRRIYG